MLRVYSSGLSIWREMVFSEAEKLRCPSFFEVSYNSSESFERASRTHSECYRLSESTAEWFMAPKAVREKIKNDILWRFWHFFVQCIKFSVSIYSFFCCFKHTCSNVRICFATMIAWTEKAQAFRVTPAVTKVDSLLRASSFGGSRSQKWINRYYLWKELTPEQFSRID